MQLSSKTLCTHSITCKFISSCIHLMSTFRCTCKNTNHSMYMIPVCGSALFVLVYIFATLLSARICSWTKLQLYTKTNLWWWLPFCSSLTNLALFVFVNRGALNNIWTMFELWLSRHLESSISDNTPTANKEKWPVFSSLDNLYRQILKLANKTDTWGHSW